ncbi:hypothetical protein B0H10DRAFT_519164 [Mycena sp. CBHHK59/15]|nr:hypothetical protein B0H10DRAFT_519164 [Mycena sp. CBHHK59/15]
MHLTSWPTSETHLLHLAADGEIHPHVDSITASGSWILAVSLGAERLLRLQGPKESSDFFEVLLPSGSVYIQRDSLRFEYKHSIPRMGTFEGREITGGQRVSIMAHPRTCLRLLDYIPSLHRNPDDLMSSLCSFSRTANCEFQGLPLQ